MKEYYFLLQLHRQYQIQREKEIYFLWDELVPINDFYKDWTLQTEVFFDQIEGKEIKIERTENESSSI